jgi:hypothetical protein
MWLEPSADGDLIQMDTGTVRTVALQIVNQVIRGADAMGIHFNNLGTANTSTCLCDVWESSIPGLIDEVGALGEAVVVAFHDYLAATNDALARASRLEADQAQAAASSGLGAGSGPTTDGGFGALLAQAIVNDANNANIATWVGGGSGTSQVEILLAMQNQGGAGLGTGFGTAFGPNLGSIAADSNDAMAKTWLAPDGTSYAGQDDSGRDLYKDRYGDTGTMSQIHRDKYDENDNGSVDDNDI